MDPGGAAGDDVFMLGVHLVLAALVSLPITGIALVASRCRRSTSYLLVAFALVALVVHNGVAAGTIFGVVQDTCHHLAEHDLDVTIAALRFRECSSCSRVTSQRELDGLNGMAFTSPTILPTMSRTGPAWRLIREEARPGPLNMAIDEIAAQTAAGGGPRTIRVYQWAPSTLSLGYNQRPETVAWDHCAENDVSVVRRQTGGGGIYHDTYGDISYSISAPRDDLPGDLMEAYHVLLEPILDAFDRMGVDARLVEDEHPALYEPACYLRPLHPAHDLVAGPAGRKISGNAQYRTRDAVVQHGSLSYALQPERHLATFTHAPISNEAFEGRVTSIEAETGIDRSKAVAAVETALESWAGAETSGWTEAELTAARDLAREKYESDAWNRDRVDPTD